MDGGRLPVDWAERERVRTDFDHNLVVEAGAGTGKTTLLVDRTLHAISTGTLRLSRMVIVTYLEKAAIELRQRIRARLEQSAHTGEVAARSFVERALYELPTARIGTLHGLGHGILLRHAIEMGLDPNMVVWDAVETDRQRRLALRQWFTRPHPEVFNVMRLGISYPEFERVLEAVPELPGDETAWGEPPESVDDLLKTFSTTLDRLSDAIAAAAPDSEDRGVRQVAEWREKIGRLQSLPASAVAGRLYDLKLEAPVGSQENWGSHRTSLVEQKAELRALRARLDTWQAAVAGAAGQRLVAAGQDFARFFQTWRQERRAVIYDDQVRLVAAALRDSAIRQDEATSLDAIMVDEYQDTSPVQVEIVNALAAGPNGAGEAPPPAGRLVLVGDPKQSIYGFNGADLTQAQRWSTDLVARGGAVLVPITVNFRSRPPIVDAVNQTFAAVFNTDASRDPQYRPLVPYREPQPGPAVHRFRLHDDEKGTQKKRQREQNLSSDAARAREAAAVAALIGRALNEGWMVGDGRERRPLQLRDVTILVPGRTGLDLYHRALDEAGIPVLGGAGRDFYRRDEVRGLGAVLRAVVLPEDALAVVAALRSPFFGVEDRELMRHRTAGGRFSLDRPGGPEGPVRDALGTLSTWAGWWMDRGLTEVLERAAALVREQFDAREAANVNALIEECARYASRWGAAEYVDWLWARIVAGDEGDEAVPDAASDAVSFSTIHRAKGLEWPLVIVASLRHERPPRRDPLVYDPRSQEFGLRIGGRKTASFAKVEEEVRAEEDAERRRLWYVALTRARDHLVILESDPEVVLFKNLAVEEESWPAAEPVPARGALASRPAGPVFEPRRSISAEVLADEPNPGAGSHLRMRSWVRRMLSRSASARTDLVASAPPALREGLLWIKGRPWVPAGSARTGVPVHVEGSPGVDDVIDVMVETEAGAILVNIVDGRNAGGTRDALARMLAALAAAGMPVAEGVLAAPDICQEWHVETRYELSD